MWIKNMYKIIVFNLIFVSLAFSSGIKKTYEGISLQIISKTLTDSTAYKRLAYIRKI